jgi:nitrogen fixation NifU-like protein
VAEALDMVEKFQAMMRGEVEFPKEHRKLNVMQGVAQFPVRIKCANLCWHTLKAALEATDANADAQADFVSNE